MKNQHREMFFFTEKYTGKDFHHHEIVQPWKNTLNYINRFSISEEDAFDIAGVYTMNNSSHLTKSQKKRSKKSKSILDNMLKKTYPSRAEILSHLSGASGIVHVFISGMKLYRDYPGKIRESYVELNQIIRDCISIVDSENVESLRVSVMELRVSGKIRPSLGIKINSMDVRDLYRKQHKSLVSFNNDLDTFYSQCLENSIENEPIQFFHAQQLTLDEFQSFQNSFEKWFHLRITNANQKNCKNYTKILGKFASTQVFKNTDWNDEFQNAKNIFAHNVSQLN